MPCTTSSQLLIPCSALQQLAFSAVSLALRYYVEDRRSQSWRMHHGVIRKQAGAGPNDPGSFKLTDYMGLPLGAERIQTQA